MSAALHFPALAAAAEAQPPWHGAGRKEKPISEAELLGLELLGPELLDEKTRERELREPAPREEQAPVRSLAFYRKHTEKILVRYLYASLLVGRAPEMFREPLTRGWVSHRRVKTFEDSAIFVFDMEKCLARLSALERILLGRVVLQGYSLEETALLLRVPMRSITRRHWEALDRLTQILLDEGMLIVPTT